MTPMIDFGPLLPEYPSEIIMGALLMILVWLVLRAKVVPMFEQMYVERADKIQGGMERASKAQAQAEAALAQYRAQLDGAREEAAKIREDAKAQAAQFLAEQRQRAANDVAAMLEQARHQIAAERQQAAEQLRGDVGGLAATLAGKILGESLEDDTRAKASIDRFIADLEVGVKQGQPT